MPSKLFEPVSFKQESEDDFFKSIISQNNERLTNQQFSFGKEAKQFLGFSGTMIWSFPVAIVMRWQIRKNPRLKKILQFQPLIAVRNNIEKGSFAYDTLLFRENIFSIIKNKSHLANLVCLAILFGDEFLDGIAKEYGKKETKELIFHSGLNFYLQKRTSASGCCELFYEFDICSLIPQKILSSFNSKYNISYEEFYQHLLYLLSEMNRQLKKFSPEKALTCAELICKICNRCFDTYKVDVGCFNEFYSLQELEGYQRSKDDDIIIQLLNLRAELLNKRTLQYQKQFSSWSNIIRSMQLYDDMEDAAYDCDYQMNTCCWIARTYFNNEWQWLLTHKDAIKDLPPNEINIVIALNMPGSCMLVIQYAKNISTEKLNWVQQKIVNYLWRKNWLGMNGQKFSDNGLGIPSHLSSQEQLKYLINKMDKIDHYLVSNQMKKAWVIDIACMDYGLRKFVLSKMKFSERYMLTQHFLQCSIYKKSEMLDRLL